MLIPDIRWWNELALEMLETSLSKRITTIDDVHKQLADIRNLPGWSGAAADAAQRRFIDTANQLTDEAAALGAVRAMTTQARAAVARVKQTLADIERQAAEAGLEVWDTGHVTIADKPNAPDEASVESLRLELIADARAVMRQADDIIADAAAVMNKAADGLITDGDATDTTAAAETGAAQGGLTALAPPENATPQQNAAYWDALTDQQRREVIDQHPDWVGNRDGIPAAVRHEANVARIDDERARLTAERDRLEQDLTDNPPTGTGTNEVDLSDPRSTELTQVKAKLADLDTIEKILGEHPLNPNNPDDGARLLMLDMQSNDIGLAAIGIGDVDNADHVSVTVPGVTSNIGSLEGMTGEASALQQESLTQLKNAGIEDQTVATVAWLGYQPPPELFDPDTVTTGQAEEGAPRLASFFQGIDAASTNSDPHITALGHSYGSVTTSLALQELGSDGPVDDAVFYGSPGLLADDESDLGLEQGHGYVMRSPDDPIAKADTLETFGRDPVTTAFEQISTRATTTPDGVPREDSPGHSNYPRTGANGNLRTATYNMAIVVAGLGQQDGKLVR